MTLATVCRGGMLRVISAFFASLRFVRSGAFATRDDSLVAAQDPCAPSARSIRNGDSFISLQLKSA
jgi:hypothetical protein